MFAVLHATLSHDSNSRRQFTESQLNRSSPPAANVNDNILLTLNGVKNYARHDKTRSNSRLSEHESRHCLFNVANVLWRKAGRIIENVTTKSSYNFEIISTRLTEVIVQYTYET